jgi:hypothetical protein
MTALDDRRFRRPVGMGNPNLHAAAGFAYKLELGQVTHLVSGSCADQSVEYRVRGGRHRATRRP